MKKHLHSIFAMIVGYVVGFANGIDYIDPTKYPNLIFHIFIGFFILNISGIPEKLREWAGLIEPKKESN